MRGPSIKRSAASVWLPFRDLAPHWAVIWLDRVDPGAHRRIKGLRLVTAYALAAMLGAMPEVAQGVSSRATLSALASGFALWASVSEAQATRGASCRDLMLLSGAATVGAASYILLAPMLGPATSTWPELILAAGAFLVGALRCFGVTGAGVGSQVYIGQLLAFGLKLTAADLPGIGLAGLVAAVASIVPRMLSGPAERPALPPSPVSFETAITMGSQAAVAAAVIVSLNAAIGLTESAWAITASTYVVASSAAGTIDRVRRRIIGTAIGVPIGLAFLPLTADVPLLAWAAAAVATVIYAMALPERYDVACGAFVFILIDTLALAGEHSMRLLSSRAWETVLGGAAGLMACGVVILLGRIRSAARTNSPR
jgi:hypothetical protein